MAPRRINLLWWSFNSEATQECVITGTRRETVYQVDCWRSSRVWWCPVKSSAVSNHQASLIWGRLLHKHLVGAKDLMKKNFWTSQISCSEFKRSKIMDFSEIHSSWRSVSDVFYACGLHNNISVVTQNQWWCYVEFWWAEGHVQICWSRLCSGEEAVLIEWLTPSALSLMSSL